jgi:hypothetical protein
MKQKNPEQLVAKTIRPLSVLTPLIVADIKEGDDASVLHYRKVGELLLEARRKEWRSDEEFWEWAVRSFKRSRKRLEQYIELAKGRKP